MGYIYTIAFLILLIIITIFLLIFTPKPKCFFNVFYTCKELLLLENDFHFNNIKEEIYNFSKNNENNIILFENNKLNNQFVYLPKTYEILRTIPNLKNIQLLFIKNDTKNKKNKGDPDIVNDTLSVILPIKISGLKKTKIWCDGESKFFEEGKIIIFDASRYHLLHNKHKKNTTVYLQLIIDRPENIPKGIA